MQSQEVQWIHIIHPTSNIKTCIHNNLTLTLSTVVILHHVSLAQVLLQYSLHFNT